MANVTLTCVSKVYAGGIPAVNRLNLAIRDHELMVVVGPSGCGKSTTLRLVAGLEEATSGEIVLGERVVNDVPPKDRDVAMVFQNYALYPHLTVYSNLAFGLEMRRRELGLSRAEIDGKVRATAERLALTGLLDRRPQELSGGQRQRVAVGRAIVRSPKVYLFDEPLSNLDAQLRVEMRGELKRIQRSLGTTTLYVTHDQEEAMSLGDRVAIMRHGELHQVGAPMALYDAPADRFVAGFLGTPTMNFLDGRLTRREGGWRFEMEAFGLDLPWSAVAQDESIEPGRPVTLGIRPEAITLTGESANASPWRAVVQWSEPMGDRLDVYMTTENGAQLVSRVAPSLSVKEGDRLSVQIDASRLYVFEPGEAGRNLAMHGSGVCASVD